VNVEKRVIKWLEASGIVSGYFVSGDKIKAKSLPEKFILVDRTGGAREAMVLDMAEILIEVYHKTSRFEASEKANAIADAMQQNNYLQREITAARTVYNSRVTQWNTDIFSWPTKMIVAAQQGYTTRIPFTATAETREAARGKFF